MTQKEAIGIIGTGVMGKSMAEHLLRAGYNVFVYTRTKEKANELMEQGATWQDSVADVAKQADIMITMIGTPEDVKEVYFGEEGILANAQAGTTLIDMTTSSPRLAVEIYEAAKESKMDALDAPVSGGDVGARNAALAIMVGGDKAIFEKMYPVFEIMGKNIVYQGEAGAGQHTKMVNQISIAPAMVGLCEALIYIKRQDYSQIPFLTLFQLELLAVGH